MRRTGWMGLLLLPGVLLLVAMPPGLSGFAQESRPQESAEQAGEAPAAEDQGQDEPVETPPLDLGLQEEAGVTLLFLDVKVRDKKGRPVRGLTLDDFEVTIGGRLWPLAAVDDFCTCETAAQAIARRRDRGENPAAGSEPGRATSTVRSRFALNKPDEPEAGAPEPPGESPPQHFVLYFEFSEMQHTGRVEAQRQARRWIAEGMQPGDRVMLAGYATATGLVEITPFTTDKGVLLQALEEAFADKAFIDSFPLLLPDRMRDCPVCYASCLRDGSDHETCTMTCCLPYAREESAQGRRALETLDLFISSLEDLPGRKQILYFNQNNLIRPQIYYPPLQGMQAWSVTDQRQALEKVAATATATRTAINVATMPFLAGITNELGDQVVNLGWNLADFSGGIASRTLYDLPTTLDRAGRECCIYRLAVRVPEDPPRRTLTAKVAVRGEMLAPSYRVRFYTPQERWMRHARLALMTTSRSPDPELQLALLPVSRQEGQWSVDAQVALALENLELVPSSTERIGRWRVGALLDRDDGDETWEMLTLARATLKGNGGTGLEALHSRRLEGLKAGEYRLRAFLEDAELSTFRSREIRLTLPGPDGGPGEKPWLSGPAVARRSKGRVDLDLAPVTGKPPVTSTVNAAVPGFVPVNNTEVAAGTILEFRTLFCPGSETDAKPRIMSILLLDDLPLARLPAAAVAEAGECLTLTDTVDTAPLAPGDYTYRLMVGRGDDEPLVREAVLTLWK